MIKKLLCILLLSFTVACSPKLQSENMILTGFDASTMQQYQNNKEDYGVAIVKISVKNKDQGNKISNALYSKTTAFETIWLYNEGKEIKETKWFNITDGRAMNHGNAGIISMAIKGVSSKIAEDQEYRVLLLKPGTYAMKYYKMYNVNRLGFESIHESSRKFKKTYASFNINPREVVYLGDVVLSMENMYIMSMMGSSTRMRIEIQDNFDNTIDLLKNSKVLDDLKKEDVEMRLIRNFLY